MSRMKIASEGRHFSYRAIVSSIIGEAADSLIFFPLALGGVIPTEALLPLMLWQVVLKTVYEIIVLPLTSRVIKRVKRFERVDTYDVDINYSIWKVFNI